MRLAGSREIFSALARRLAAGESAKADDKLAAFFDAYALLQSKGYEQGTAQQLAEDIAQGQAEMPQRTKRFARIYGDPS